MTAPAAMPSEEDVARAIVASRNLPEGCEINWPQFRSDARAALDLFAPILADARTTNSESWRQMAMDEHQKLLAAEAAVRELTDAKQKIYLMGVKHAEERAAAEANFKVVAQENQDLIDKLDAAESALAAERERCAKIAERVGNFGDYKREELTPDFGLPRFDMMTEIAAAIRAQGE